MNGNSYEDCKKIAEEINTKLKPFITEHGSMPWKQLSEEVNHDELVYKLVLKYLRRDEFDIGNMDNPQITLSSN
jgi:hydroxymethylpyrimidine pyrophosphatase-like HAD family hydrolase